LHKIRDSKKGDDSLVADAMALFATLSSQHTQVLNEAQLEYDKVYEARERCEEERDVLDEQLSYMAYLDTEYDLRPWKDDLVSVPASANHATIKAALDRELLERRTLCERSKAVDSEVVELRASEAAVRSELEKVRKVMEPIGSPAFLEGVEPCVMVDTELTGPLYTLHQLLYTAAREVKGVTVSTTKKDPFPRPIAHDLLSFDSSLLVLTLPSGACVVFRYHPQIKCITCDDSIPDRTALCKVVEGEDGVEPPHTSLLYHLPQLGEMVREGRVGRVFCWLHELCGLPVVTQRQRLPSNITANKLLLFLSTL